MLTPPASSSLVSFLFSISLVIYIFDFLWLLLKGLRYWELWHCFELLTYCVFSIHLYYMFMQFVTPWQSVLWSNLNLFDYFFETKDQYVSKRCAEAMCYYSIILYPLFTLYTPSFIHVYIYLCLLTPYIHPHIHPIHTPYTFPYTFPYTP